MIHARGILHCLKILDVAFATVTSFRLSEYSYTYLPHQSQEEIIKMICEAFLSTTNIHHGCLNENGTCVIHIMIHIMHIQSYSISNMNILMHHLKYI